MPLLSIIGCELFKKEIAQVLMKDGAIENLVIVNGKDADFRKAFEGTGARVQSVSADSIPLNLKKSKGFNVLVTLQNVSLKSNSCKLNKEIYEKIKFYGKISDGVLLLYDQEDDEMENIVSAFSRSRFSLKSVGSYAGFSAGKDIILSHDKEDGGSSGKEIQEIYQKLYTEMRAELGRMDQLT